MLSITFSNDFVNASNTFYKGVHQMPSTTLGFGASSSHWQHRIMARSPSAFSRKRNVLGQASRPCKKSARGNVIYRYFLGWRGPWISSSGSKELKGIFTDSNNIFLWHESEDINVKKNLFLNFSWFQFYILKLCMIMCVSLLP